MKKILLVAVLLGAILSVSAYVVCVASPLTEKRITGSGKLVTRTINAPDYDGIDASRAVKVIITDKLTDKIEIKADDNLIDLVVVRVDDNELKVTIDKKYQNISNSNVTVTVPANGHIRSLEASSASMIETAVGLSAPEFSIDASSAAKIKAAVKATKCEIDASSASKIDAAVSATECEIDASSAAKITLAGKADRCHAELSSASKLAASDFVVADYVIETSSGSDASINCNNTLNASASSGSDISYSGKCANTVNINKSSGGSVRKD